MLPEARAVHAGLTWLPLPVASVPVSLVSQLQPRWTHRSVNRRWRRSESLPCWAAGLHTSTRVLAAAPRDWTGGSLAQLVTIRQVVRGVPLSLPGCQGWALKPWGGRACVFTAPCSHSPGLPALVVPREIACSSVGTHSEGDGSGQVGRLGYFNFPPIFPAKLVIITLIFQAKFLRPIPRRL